VTLSATATAATGANIASVEFFDGTTSLGKATASPYSVKYTFTTAGAKSITAKITDDKGGVFTTPASTTTVGDSARVRAVHASADALGVDVFLNDLKAVTNITFGTAQPAAGYVFIPAVSTTIKINPTGTTTTAYTLPAPVVPDAGKSYTFIALGKLIPPTTFSVETYVDDITAPADGKAKIRVIHAASTAPAKVNVYASDPGVALPAAPAVTALEYKKASAYLTVDAKAYQFRVTSDTSTAVAINVPTFTLVSGKIYTFIALDPAPGAAATAFTILPLTDN